MSAIKLVHACMSCSKHAHWPTNLLGQPSQQWKCCSCGAEGRCHSDILAALSEKRREFEAAKAENRLPLAE